MTSRRNINYTRLAVDEDNIGSESTFDPRFDMPPETLDKVPWKSVALALFLFFFGSMLLLLALFIFTGHMGGDRSQAYGLLGLGTLTFLPGFYETRIAYYSWRGAQGYRPSLVSRYRTAFLVSAVARALFCLAVYNHSCNFCTNLRYSVLTSLETSSNIY